MTILNSDLAKELFYYCPDTGNLYWKVKRKHSISIGDIAGCLTKFGYIQIKLFGRSYRAHRIAWLIVHGKWPENLIDHINGIKTDNRLSNLRDVTNSVNQQNQKKAQKHNFCGMLGVSFHKKKRRFRAIITIDGKVHNLGNFDTAEQAHSFYLLKKREIHPGYVV